ncbi:hypothetical protein P7K49_024613 [Saguinus oedipus]|uniref:Peptidase M12B domain-containing protein n=1 Tax=Saguinus oedipus TaxID=9490 RepID=A0ABQ9UQ14_SAGOE|nr:hypothetical protein P7K49_024613 [Saguinus oedipus]
MKLMCLALYCVSEPSFVEITSEHLGRCAQYPFPMVFSSCSKKDLESSLEKGMGMCLFNLPEVKQSFAGQKCGNGFVEEGEECDCGEPEDTHSQQDEDKNNKKASSFEFDREESPGILASNS